jgi:chromosome segregation ATPase
MEAPNSTTLILDLRDRMARIETKLDAHHDAHTVIDRRLDKIEAEVASLDDRITSNRSDIDAGKAKVATLGAVGGGVIAVATMLGDHLWSLFRIN